MLSENIGRNTKQHEVLPKAVPMQPERDPVLICLLREALLPLLIQTPHLAKLLHVSLDLLRQGEIWRLQVETGAVLTDHKQRKEEENRGEDGRKTRRENVNISEIERI